MDPRLDFQLPTQRLNEKRPMDSQLDFQLPTQRSNKKRRMDSQLDFQLPRQRLKKKRPMHSQLDSLATQHKCLGLSREGFLPRESSIAQSHPMIVSWQQGPTSARPMPQQF